jgi:hypothetical protein
MQDAIAIQRPVEKHNSVFNEGVNAPTTYHPIRSVGLI